MADIESEIRDLLGRMTEPGSSNTMSVEDIREWLNGLLDDYADEFAGQPERLASGPLWDLIAADTNPTQEALFVAVVLRGDDARLVSGRGNPSDVRRFGDSDFPQDATRLLEELRKRFVTTSEPLVLSREDVEEWLRRH